MIQPVPNSVALLERGAGEAAALAGGFGWAFWACAVLGLAAVPVTFLLVRRNELAQAVAGTVGSPVAVGQV
jgi:hypothetical protein